MEVTPRVTARVLVEAHLGGGDESDTFDPTDERLRRAASSLAQTLGHGVALYFDVPGLPRPRRPFFEQLFSRRLGALAERLSALRAEDPLLSSFVTAALRRVVFTYDGAHLEPEARFDAASGDWTLSLGRSAELPYDVESSLARAFREHLARRFEGREGPQIEAAELPLYLRFLLVRSASSRGYRSAQALADSPSARSVLEVLALLPRLEGTPELALAARRWLAQRVGDWVYARCHHAEWVAAAPSDGPWRAAEEAWGRWLLANLDALEPALRREVLGQLFRAEVGSACGTRVAGLELQELGQRLLDRWVRAGRPGPGAPAQDPSLAIVVEPLARGGFGVSPWMRWTLRTPEARAHLVESIAARRDPMLAEATAQALRDEGTPAELAALWRATGPDEASWRAVARVVPAAGRAAYDECAFAWRAHPSRRAQVLAVLLELDAARRGLTVDWGSFERLFGGAVSQPEYAALLAQGTRYAEGAWRLFPALAPGFPRVGPALAAMGAPVGDAPVPLEHASATEGAVLAMLATLRAARDAAGEAQLRAHLEARRAGQAPEARAALDALLLRVRRGDAPARRVEEPF